MSEYEPLVLMVEDSADILHLNGKWLAEAGFATASAETLTAARKILAEQPPDIIVLDILLPDGNGFDFLPELQTLSDAPILFCTIKNEDIDIVRGLKGGGDDYIPKPYNVEILVARVEAMWRREQENREKILAAKSPERIIKRGPLKLDLAANRAYINGKDMLLKPKEFALLSMLMQEEGKVISAERLFETVWKAPVGDDKGALKRQASSLRKKLESEACGYTVKNAYGEGYCFEKL